jgi:hypothetical protein
VFEHVTVLLSLVYVVALTHLLSSGTELLIARKRVRFSGLYLAWTVIALVVLLGNWLAFWGLSALKHWSVAEVLVQFLTAIIQYFTCSTLRVNETQGEEPIDLPAIFEDRRPVIFGAFLGLVLIAMFENWWDRNNLTGFDAKTWIGEDLALVPMAVGVVAAGWMRLKWLQWTAAAVVLGINVFFLMTYALPAN